jgi:hypothetical protein
MEIEGGILTNKPDVVRLNFLFELANHVLSRYFQEFPIVFFHVTIQYILSLLRIPNNMGHQIIWQAVSQFLLVTIVNHVSL